MTNPTRLPLRFIVMRARVTHCVAIVCALALLPGCSWIFVEHAPPDHAHRTDFTCTTTRAAPIADTVFATVFGGLVAMMISNAHCRDHFFEKSGFAPGGPPTGPSCAELTAVVAVPAVLFAASTINGFDATAECDAAPHDVPREYVAITPQNQVVPAPPPPPLPVPAPRRGADGTLEYTFEMSDVRVDLRASVDNTERVQVGFSRVVPTDRVITTPCDTWSIVAGDTITTVAGGRYRTTREAAGQRETFVNEVPITALRQFVDGSAQGLAAIDLCRERLYLSMSTRNELARFFEELDAMVRERAPSETPPPIAPVEAAPVTTP